MEHEALIVEYLKSIQEKIRTNSKILTKQVEKIVWLIIEYVKAMH